jgi:predicted RNA-binding Zn-ribbon protein involved in translation (DUF1610 family)
MRKSKYIPRPKASIELPKCPKCGEEMWLARIEPIEPGYDICTYECPTCDNRITKIGEYRKPAAYRTFSV